LVQIPDGLAVGWYLNSYSFLTMYKYLTPQEISEFEGKFGHFWSKDGYKGNVVGKPFEDKLNNK